MGGALPPFGGNEIELLLSDPQNPSLVGMRGSTDTRKGEKVEGKNRAALFHAAFLFYLVLIAPQSPLY